MSADCIFFDVGQGSSQVIYLDDGKAIVIDGGPRAEVPLEFLERHVDTIEALIVTHNDRDHHCGALDILLQYKNAIKKLYFLEDRPVDQIGLYEHADRMLVEGSLQECSRLERNANYFVLYEDKTKDLYLELLFPTFLENCRARQHCSPNGTSAVLALVCGSRRIVFSGDATLDAWRCIHERMERRPIRSDLLAVPHHGGVIWQGRKRGEQLDQYEQRVRTHLHWLYRDVVPTRFAVISVGSDNRFKHPRPWVIEELCKVDSHVLCTQMTSQCAKDLESVRRQIPGFKNLPVTPAADADPRRRENRNVPCAGTIVAEITAQYVTIEQLQSHQTWIRNLGTRPNCNPLCQRYSQVSTEKSLGSDPANLGVSQSFPSD